MSISSNVQKYLSKAMVLTERGKSMAVQKYCFLGFFVRKFFKKLKVISHKEHQDDLILTVQADMYGQPQYPSKSLVAFPLHFFTKLNPYFEMLIKLIYR